MLIPTTRTPIWKIAAFLIRPIVDLVSKAKERRTFVAAVFRKAVLHEFKGLYPLSTEDMSV